MTHEIVLKEEDYQSLKQKALEVFDGDREMTVNVIMEEMMDQPFVPMHYPYHHYILPAALLTASAIEVKMQREELEEKLEIVKDRSKNILAGFCGFYGACGSGVGTGIFASVLTGTSPMSDKTWQWTNQVTSISLQAIASVPGPRCCKRTGYLSLQASVPYLNEKLKLHLKTDDEIICRYYEMNAECKKNLCPFFKVAEV
ncbi:hypothetical protein DSECCO2_39070 [anaerobic digester metagenome]|uniref:DUF5714 domain-containing protein n=1 Tax=Acetobacterium wieringae TaxID=52694 RepID=UPI0020331F42|nr:DUF5714 domain-containing protein [Acetobacterium wieringae]URN85905.1 DUF5714 domain-containing protein [Acetobacterium wieringae]